MGPARERCQTCRVLLNLAVLRLSQSQLLLKVQARHVLHARTYGLSTCVSSYFETLLSKAVSVHKCLIHFNPLVESTPGWFRFSDKIHNPRFMDTTKVNLQNRIHLPTCRGLQANPKHNKSHRRCGREHITKLPRLLLVVIPVLFQIVCLFRFHARVEIDQTLTPHAAVEMGEEKFLTVKVVGGVTNQLMEIMDAVVIARSTNRTLVLPPVIASLPKGQLYGGASLQTSPFDALWDPDHFSQCVHRKMGVRTVNFIETGNQRVSNSFYHVQPWGGVDALNHSKPLMSGGHPISGALQTLRNDMATVMHVGAPFLFLVRHPKFLLPHLFRHDLSDCFEPSPGIQDLIRRYKPLQDKYVCVHARIEMDWFKACCKDLDRRGPSHRLDPRHPQEWICSDGRRPQRRCYSYATDIVARIKRETPTASVAWIASGASPIALQPITEQFPTPMGLPAVNRTVYTMDYRMALADQAICGSASEIWTQSGSTFLWGQDIGDKKMHYYNLNKLASNAPVSKTLHWIHSVVDRWRSSSS